jgi:hypothetical protein
MLLLLTMKTDDGAVGRLPVHTGTCTGTVLIPGTGSPTGRSQEYK